MAYTVPSIRGQRQRVTVPLTLAVLASFLVATGWAATVADVAKNPSAFDQKAVTVQGAARSISDRVSRRGNPYTTLNVTDQGQALKVFSFGTPTIKDGDRIEVQGVFRRVKRVGPYTFYDEIEASSISPLK